MKLITTYNPPPIPIRQFDWTCIDENYEGGDIIGTGETEEAAIADYWEQLLDVRTQDFLRVNY